MGNDFRILYGPGAAKQLKEVAFGGVVGEVAYIEAGVGNGDDFG